MMNEQSETNVEQANRKWDSLSPYAKEKVEELFERRFGRQLSQTEFRVEERAGDLLASIRSYRASW